jgi:hypothetical protein
MPSANAGKCALENCKLNAEGWASAGDARIAEWLERRGLAREHSVLADNGPLEDAKSVLLPIARDEERFHHDAIVQFRRAQLPRPADLEPRSLSSQTLSASSHKTERVRLTTLNKALSSSWLPAMRWQRVSVTMEGGVGDEAAQQPAEQPQPGAVRGGGVDDEKEEEVLL